MREHAVFVFLALITWCRTILFSSIHSLANLITSFFSVVEYKSIMYICHTFFGHLSVYGPLGDSMALLLWKNNNKNSLKNVQMFLW